MRQPSKPKKRVSDTNLSARKVKTTKSVAKRVPVKGHMNRMPPKPKSR